MALSLSLSSLVLSSSSSPLDQPQYFIDQEFLTSKNLENTSVMAPFLAYLVLLMLVGLVGNALTFVIYYTRFSSCSSRTFILSMSLCDLLTNVWALLTEVLDARYHYTFYAVWFCKISKLVMGMLILISGLILVVVAVDRQKLVCGKYTRGQSAWRTRVGLLACIVVAVVLSLPRSVLYGKRTTDFNGTNITGVQCNIGDEHLRSFFPVIYNALNAFVFVVIVLVMAVCYGRVGITLWRHKKMTRAHKRTSSVSSGSAQRSRLGSSYRSDTEASKDENRVPNGAGADSQLCSVLVSYQTSPDAKASAPSSNPTGQNSGSSGKASSKNRSGPLKLTITPAPVVLAKGPQSPTSSTTGRGMGRSIPSRTTLMLFILTALFVVNFLPYLVMEVILALAPRSGVWDLPRSLLFLLFRSYYINSAVNPFVYSFCSAKFRADCVRLLRGLWKR